MNPAVIVLSLLLFSSIVMASAMAIAWLHFGRQRYVMMWALAYCASILQWTANIVSFFGNIPDLMMISAVAVVLHGTLMAAGVWLRSARPVPWRLFTGMGAVIAVSGMISYPAFASMPRLGMIVPVYIGLLLGSSAWVLRPKGRRFTSPELALCIMLGLFALFETALAVAAARIPMVGPIVGIAVFRAIIGLFLPPLYVGSGVAAVLVVAGDLAQQLRRLSSHDALTGILNRRGLEEAAMRAIANARRSGRPLALVICDLDGFKALNDRHGHIAGDAALRGFAQLLVSTTRRGDVVGRMGGDEFGLLLVDSDAPAAAEVMERVRAEIGCLVLSQAPDAPLRASFGVAELWVGDTLMEDVVARADTALYRAKESGKDQVSIWRAAA